MAVLLQSALFFGNSFPLMSHTSTVVLRLKRRAVRLRNNASRCKPLDRFSNPIAPQAGGFGNISCGELYVDGSVGVRNVLVVEQSSCENKARWARVDVDSVTLGRGCDDSHSDANGAQEPTYSSISVVAPGVFYVCTWYPSRRAYSTRLMSISGYKRVLQYIPGQVWSGI